MTVHCPVTLPDLERRLSRKIEAHKGIQLTPEELDLLVLSGAYDVFRQAVAEYQRTQCLQRSARSRSISGEPSDSTAGPIEKTSKSFGTIANEDANEALALAQALTGKA